MAGGGVKRLGVEMVMGVGAGLRNSIGRVGNGWEASAEESEKRKLDDVAVRGSMLLLLSHTA